MRLLFMGAIAQRKEARCGRVAERWCRDWIACLARGWPDGCYRAKGRHRDCLGRCLSTRDKDRRRLVEEEPRCGDRCAGRSADDRFGSTERISRRGATDRVASDRPCRGSRRFIGRSRIRRIRSRRTVPSVGFPVYTTVSQSAGEIIGPDGRRKSSSPAQPLQRSDVRVKWIDGEWRMLGVSFGGPTGTP